MNLLFSFQFERNVSPFVLGRANKDSSETVCNDYNNLHAVSESTSEVFVESDATNKNSNMKIYSLNQIKCEPEDEEEGEGGGEK